MSVEAALIWSLVLMTYVLIPMASFILLRRVGYTVGAAAWGGARLGSAYFGVAFIAGLIMGWQWYAGAAVALIVAAFTLLGAIWDSE